MDTISEAVVRKNFQMYNPLHEIHRAGGFVAMVGLKAGPIFVSAEKTWSLVLFFSRLSTTLTPLIAGLFFGRYVLRVLSCWRRVGRCPNNDRGSCCGSRKSRQCCSYAWLLVHSRVWSYPLNDIGYEVIYLLS